MMAMREAGLSEAGGMNALQDAGVISDLCVWADDVHKDDVPRAIQWLKFEYAKEKV